MAVVMPKKLGQQIAEALGIKYCRKLEITIEVGKPIAVKAEFYPEADGVMQLPAILQEYELHEKSDTKGAK